MKADFKKDKMLRTGHALEDELFNLKEENNALKKHLNTQEDKTKKLLTKVQRLSNDLRKEGPNLNSNVQRELQSGCTIF